MLNRVSVGLLLIVLCLAAPSTVGAQTKPTQAERKEWSEGSPVLETSSCKKITWLLESERGVSTTPPGQQPMRHMLGWWGRGFIEGAVSILGEKAQTKATEF